MTVGVVYLFEMIQVEYGQAKAARIGYQCETLGKGLIPCPAIGQAGQRIGEGLGVQAVLQFGDRALFDAANARFRPTGGRPTAIPGACLGGQIYIGRIVAADADHAAIPLKDRVSVGDNNLGLLDLPQTAAVSSQIQSDIGRSISAPKADIFRRFGQQQYFHWIQAVFAVINFDLRNRKRFHRTLIIAYSHCLQHFACLVESSGRNLFPKRGWYVMATETIELGPVPTWWTRRHLLGLEELSAEEILLILDKAAIFKQTMVQGQKRLPLLAGKTCVTLFFENSTRTRTSFSLAARRLGADTVDFSASTSSLSKGETFIDTAKNIEAMGVDAVIVRHRTPGTPQLLAQNLHCAVINAGDGPHEHPTQGLLDIMTIRQHRGRIEGLTVALVGDIAHSRTARSNIWGLKNSAHM